MLVENGLTGSFPNKLNASNSDKTYPILSGKKVRNAGFYEAYEGSILSEDYFLDPRAQKRSESDASHGS